MGKEFISFLEANSKEEYISKGLDTPSLLRILGQPFSVEAVMNYFRGIVTHNCKSFMLPSHHAFIVLDPATVYCMGTHFTRPRTMDEFIKLTQVLETPLLWKNSYIIKFTKEYNDKKMGVQTGCS